MKGSGSALKQKEALCCGQSREQRDCLGMCFQNEDPLSLEEVRDSGGRWSLGERVLS